MLFYANRQKEIYTKEFKVVYKPTNHVYHYVQYEYTSCECLHKDKGVYVVGLYIAYPKVQL